MLVGLAIIAMLLALVLPSLGGARDAAWKVQSRSNLSQIAIATAAYRDDYDRQFPFFRPEYGPNPDIGRITLFEAYESYLSDLTVFYAPADPVVRLGEAYGRPDYSSYQYIPGTVMGHYTVHIESGPNPRERTTTLYDLKGGLVFLEKQDWDGAARGGDDRLGLSLPGWSVAVEDFTVDRDVTGYRPSPEWQEDANADPDVAPAS